MLSVLKVIEEVMTLLNDMRYIYVLMYIIILHTIYTASLLYNDYSLILEYPVSFPLVDWQLVYVVPTQSMPQSMLHL